MCLPILFIFMIFVISTVSLLLFCLSGVIDNSSLFSFLLKFKPSKYIWAFLFGYPIFEKRSAAMFLIVAALSTLGVSISADIGSTESLSAVTVLASLGAIWVAVRWPNVKFRTLLFLGDVSYPLYLMHIPLLIGLTGFFGVINPWVLTATTIVAAILTLEFVETFRLRVRGFKLLRV